MEEYLRIGVLSNTHGLKGEVKVYPTTDDVNRFKALKTIILDTKESLLELKVEGVRFQKNMVIVKFFGYDDINDVEPFKGMDLLVARENAVALKDDEYFICDVINATVQTEEGEFLGYVKDIITTGSNDVLVVGDEVGKERLLPVISECVRNMDIPNKRITVRLMPGL